MTTKPRTVWRVLLLAVLLVVLATVSWIHGSHLPARTSREELRKREAEPTTTPPPDPEATTSRDEVEPPSEAPKSASAVALDYLSRFGYVNATSEGGKAIDYESLSQAIKTFQWFVGIKETGEMDEETQKMMASPRCGMLDVGANFKLTDSKWKKRHLVYKVTRYPSKHSTPSGKAKVDRSLKKAWSFWAQKTPLRFTQVTSGKSDFEIKFVKYKHNKSDRSSCSAFDGPAGVLAHAYFPTQGNAHFDDLENWSFDDSGVGIDLVQVATHEFGHALGLDHSNVKDALMAPVYNYKKNFKLHKDDVKGIQRLYGRRPGSLGADSVEEDDEQSGVDPNDPDQKRPKVKGKPSEETECDPEEEACDEDTKSGDNNNNSSNNNNNDDDDDNDDDKKVDEKKFLCDYFKRMRKMLPPRERVKMKLPNFCYNNDQAS